MRNPFSYRAAYQHIEPNCTFRRSFGYNVRAVLWFPCGAVVTLLSFSIWLAYTAILMPLGYLCLWYRFAAENIEHYKTQSKVEP